MRFQKSFEDTDGISISDLRQHAAVDSIYEVHNMKRRDRQTWYDEF